MKRLLISLLLLSSVLKAAIDPQKKVIPKKDTSRARTCPKKSAACMLERIRLANPGQNADALMRSPLHLRTFYPGASAYLVR